MFDYTNDQQANMVYQEELENLNGQRLMQFINHHHQKQQPRLQRLSSY